MISYFGIVLQRKDNTFEWCKVAFLYWDAQCGDHQIKKMYNIRSILISYLCGSLCEPACLLCGGQPIRTVSLSNFQSVLQSWNYFSGKRNCQWAWVWYHLKNGFWTTSQLIRNGEGGGLSRVLWRCTTSWCYTSDNEVTSYDGIDPCSSRRPVR